MHLKKKNVNCEKIGEDERGSGGKGSRALEQVLGFGDQPPDQIIFEGGGVELGEENLGLSGFDGTTGRWRVLQEARSEVFFSWRGGENKKKLCDAEAVAGTWKGRERT